MATVRVIGFSWATGAAGLPAPLLPGEGHIWAWQPFPETAPVLSLSAHPSQTAPHQALAIESLSTAYAATGQGGANFIVRNVSDTPVVSYAVFAASIGF
jgi:hypothetical protein